MWEVWCLPYPRQSWPASRAKVALRWWTACVWLCLLSPGWGRPQNWQVQTTWQRSHRWTRAHPLRSSSWEHKGRERKALQMSDCLKTPLSEKYAYIEQNTHNATCDSCSLVRLSGWLWAVIPNFVGSLLAGRLARRMPLFITLRKEPILCQPLLLNQI